MPDYDWLNIPPEAPPIKLPATLPSAIAPAVAEALSTRHELVAALRQINAAQRVFLESLVEKSFDVRRALRATRARGFAVTQWQLDRKWMHEPSFAKAIESLKDYGTLTLGISKTAILTKLSKLADDCRALVTIEDRNGNSITKPVDPGAAHAALISLARIIGVLDSRSEGDNLRTAPAINIILGDNAPQPIVQIMPTKDTDKWP